MARPKAKIPRITYHFPTQTSLTNAQWKTIERAYGQPLEQQLRDKILSATIKFVQLADAESNAGLMSEAINRVTLLRRQALALQTTFQVSSKTSSYADDTVGLKIDVKRFRTELGSFIDACDFALDVMHDSATRTFWPDGFSWEAWIRELTLVLSEAKMPTAARQDLRDISPFAKFVSGLQKECIPAKFCRSLQSMEALSKAINKARSDSKAKTPVGKRRSAKPVKANDRD